MIYISCALYIEAAPIIKYYSLKKDSDFTTYQVFYGVNITVIITGAGMIPSTISITDYFAHCIPEANDSFINFGSCACSNHSIPVGEVFLIDHITDMTTKRTYIPDILFKHDLKETCLFTSPVTVEKDNEDSVKLYDMEAAAMYQSVLKHFMVHRIFFIKVVTDHCDEGLTTDELKPLITASLTSLVSFIDVLDSYHPEPETDLTQNDKDLVQNLCTALRLSQTQQSSIICHFRYYVSKGKDINEYVNKFYKNNNLHIKNKSEGKKYYELITRDLIQ